MENLLTERIKDHLYYIGVNDRETQLFENMWPLPDGVAYNSFLMTGEKNIIIDLVKVNTVSSYIEKVQEILKEDSLDYIVINHVEPDHSSGILNILELYPDVKLICNKKTVPFLKTYYGIEDNLIVVSEGETLELGNRKLTFYMTPMVHWPESMVTYEEESKTLFSQDIFGGFGTLNGAIFDDQVKFDDNYYSETTRYFINIVGKYASQALKALNKLKDLEISTICPVHGPIWRKEPERIVKLYTDLAQQKVKDAVLIIYGSMYGNTERMAEAVARGVAKGGITDIRIRDVGKTPFSYLLAEAWETKGIILGSCSYNNNIFPPMSFLMEELKQQKMKNNIWGIFGSYSWSGGALKRLREFTEGNKCEVLERQPEIQGAANEEELRELIQLGEDMARAILES
ncbi:FprA family A-type flavoprotein [Anaerosphaera multitolerans]|uniref:FprA family A-type flavoprotein n=1 Tax=Anaerosphaera multitolerans TaxID=2487351 RepID=A0A437S9H6_9FIRM|nr:FprA family A-type flavoprotein [Anaerosphaera multitolerans]RVU55494.1 FprA family A-type flavoprotein [Anaerosphaera multitolerans]